MKNISVLVSGGGTNFQAVIDKIESGYITNARIAQVISSKADAYALSRAEKHGIKGVVIGKNEYPDMAERTQAIIRALDGEKTDLVILAGYMSVLQPALIEKYRNRIINIHPSLIPSFCGKGMYGLKVHEAALAKGVKVTGATVHYVNEIPDGGKIILQKAVDVKDGDTPEVLQRRVMEEAEWILLPMAAEIVAKKISEGE